MKTNSNSFDIAYQETVAVVVPASHLGGANVDEMAAPSFLRHCTWVQELAGHNKRWRLRVVIASW